YTGETSNNSWFFHSFPPCFFKKGIVAFIIFTRISKHAFIQGIFSTFFTLNRYTENKCCINHPRGNSYHSPYFSGFLFSGAYAVPNNQSKKENLVAKLA